MDSAVFMAIPELDRALPAGRGIWGDPHLLALEEDQVGVAEDLIPAQAHPPTTAADGQSRRGEPALEALAERGRLAAPPVDARDLLPRGVLSVLDAEGEPRLPGGQEGEEIIAQRLDRGRDDGDSRLRSDLGLAIEPGERERDLGARVVVDRDEAALQDREEEDEADAAREEAAVDEKGDPEEGQVIRAEGGERPPQHVERRAEEGDAAELRRGLGHGDPQGRQGHRQQDGGDPQ